MSSLPQNGSPRLHDGRPGAAAQAPPRPVTRLLFVAGEVGDDGLGHSVLRLARELRRRGKEVGLVCGGGALVPEFEGIGLSPELFRPLCGPNGARRLTGRVAAYVADFKPDLLHFFGRSLALCGRRLAAATGRPYVLTITSFPVSGMRQRVPGDWGHGSVLATSEELREQLVNQGRVPKDAISVVSIGIALEDYERYRDTEPPNRVAVVGIVGPLTAERGVADFVQAAREILDRGHDVRFLIAGKGREREHLRRLVRKLHIEKWVTMVHDFSDYRRMIAVLDVCVLPALSEGVSLAVIEAMACRKPVVATGVGAVYGIISDGETGFLVPRNDPKAIADKVSQLVEDPELARRLADAAYERVRERYSLQATVDELLDVYARCLERTEGS